MKYEFAHENETATEKSGQTNNQVQDMKLHPEHEMKSEHEKETLHENNAGINLTGYHPPPPPQLTLEPLIFSVKIPTPGTACQCKTPPLESKTK